jgi:hypothetical protein
MVLVIDWIFELDCRLLACIYERTVFSASIKKCLEFGFESFDSVKDL